MTKIYQSAGVRLLRMNDLKVPLQLAVGKYEEITDDYLDIHYNDICAEFERRGRETPDRVPRKSGKR
jgi:hypothetical protein